VKKLNLVLVGTMWALLFLLLVCLPANAAESCFTVQGSITHRTTWDYNNKQFDTGPVQNATVYYTFPPSL